MAATTDKRAGRRPARRSVLLVALGLVTSLGAAGAFAAVTVQRPAPAQIRALPIRVKPASRTVSPGAGAKYTVRLSRDGRREIGLSGRTRLRVRRAGLPAGSHTNFSGAMARTAGLIRRPRTTLTITTAADTPPGTYEVRLGARRPHRRGHATVELVVSSPTTPSAAGPATVEAASGPIEATAPIVPPAPASPIVTAPDAFTIAGSLTAPMTPGWGEPLDLTLTNLESTDLAITGLNVRVSAVAGPHRDRAHPCEPADFSVTQFSGAPGFTLRGASSAGLGELGFGRAEWPAIAMRDRPVNQDGCKDATLSLTFTGTATEATS